MVESIKYYLPPIDEATKGSQHWGAGLIAQIQSGVRAHLSGAELVEKGSETIVDDYTNYLKGLDRTFPIAENSRQLSLEYFLAKNVASRIIKYDSRYDHATNQPTINVDLKRTSGTTEIFDPLMSMHNQMLQSEYTRKILDRSTSRDLAHYYLEPSNSFEQFSIFK